MAMNIAEFKEYVQMTPSHHPIAVIGKHGIGKSEIVGQIAAEQLHMPMISIMVGQVSDSVDLLGLPNRIQMEFLFQDESGRQQKRTDWVTKFTLPDFFPADLTKPILLFLDECNRTESPSVFSCLLDLVLNQSIQGRKLPNGSRIMAAWNPWTEEGFYRVSELCREPAFVSRFAEVILEPTVQEFLMYANMKGFSKLVTEFIEKNSNHLDPYINSPKEAIARMRNGDKVPDRRQWEKVSEYVIKNAEWVKRNAGKPIFVEHMATKVGSHAAAAFCQFVAGRGQGVNVRLILENGDGNELKTFSELSPVDQNALNGVVRAAFGAWMTEGKKHAKSAWDKWSANLCRYLKVAHEESAMNLFSVCIEDEWLGKAFLHSPELEAMHTGMLDDIVAKAKASHR